MAEKTRILLIDDEKPFVQNLSRLLDSRGFHVVTAYDGSEGFNIFESSGPFDVVILDVKMPVKDGLQTLKEIMALEPRSLVIMLTGQATLSSGTQAIRGGAYDYLMKPCDIEDLTDKLQEACEVRSIQRHPVLWRRKRVEEITCFSFKKLGPDASLRTAIEILSRQKNEISADALYILNEKEQLLGSLTKRDLIEEVRRAAKASSISWRELRNDPDRLPTKPLRGIMKTDTPTADSSEGLRDTATRMISNNLQSMPVIHGKTMVGIIRLQDVLLHLD
ncbi:MAG: response regulator [Planctomycetota bacterium]